MKKILMGVMAASLAAGAWDSRPIGVFDSGLGGLTVLERLLDYDQFSNETGTGGADGIPDFAHERFVYLGDQANMPYGDYAAEGKSDFLKELVVDDATFLLGENFHRSASETSPTGRKSPAKILVIACNTATAWGLDVVRERLKAAGDDTKVVGVIEAGVRATLDLLKADASAQPFAVGVLATPGTISSGAYTRTLRKELAVRGVSADVPVYGQGCAGLADAVEACSPTADVIAYSNMVALVRQHVASGSKAPLRAVILGCTHFPFVQAAIRKAIADQRAAGVPLPDDFQLVDPAVYTAAECFRLLRETKRQADPASWQVGASSAFLSVANPRQNAANLTCDGQLTRAFKYGRTSRTKAGTTVPVPFTRANFGDEVFAQVGRLLPRTAALLTMPPIEGRRPVVAVSDSCIPGQASTRSGYVDAVVRAGGIPVVIPRMADTNLLVQVMAGVDALLLTGAVKGNDLPVRYAYESVLLEAAVARRIPVFGICQGHQYINRHFGGTLASAPKKSEGGVGHRGPNATTHFSDNFHDISIVPGSRLARDFGATVFTVNTSHSFCVDKLGKGLKIVARAPDGTVEAIEHESLPIRGVQFHPERCIDRDVRFLALVQAALLGR